MNEQHEKPDDLLPDRKKQDELIGEPKKLAGIHGCYWLRDGWLLFKKAPAMWMVTTVVFAVLMIVLSFIPVLPGLVQPVFSAGFALICQRLCQGQSFNIEVLFGGFKKNVVSLITVGAVMMVGTFFAIIFSMGFGMGGMMAGGQMESPEQLSVSILLPALLASLIILPLIMATWFAPILICLDDLSLLTAMRLSLKACWINPMPFLWYGLILLPLMIIAAIPFMLGYLVFVPVLVASVYLSYREIFYSDKTVALTNNSSSLDQRTP